MNSFLKRFFKFKIILFFSVFLIYCPKENVKFSLQTVDGPWEFYWMQLLEPSDFQNAKTAKGISPNHILYEFKPWSKQKINNQNLASFGYATYRTKVKIPDLDSRIGVFYPQMFTASRIWINGKEFAHTGNVSSEMSEIVPSRKNTHFSFDPGLIDSETQDIEIVFQIANNHFYQGGPRGRFWLGTEQEILSHIKKNLILDVLAFGLILGSVVYHLFFYLLNKHNKPFLFFSIVSFTFLLRLPFHNTKIYDLFTPEINWNGQALYLHFINVISILSVIYFLNSLFPKRINKYVFGFYWGGAIIALGCGFINDRILSLANLYYVSLFLPIFIIHAIHLTFFKVREKKSSYLMGIGLLGLCFFGLLAIIMNYFGYNSGSLLVVGFLIYILFQALALSRFFTIALEKRSNLQLQMLQENQEALTKQREELQIIMHDSLGSDLTDIHVNLESNLKKKTLEFNRSILENMHVRTLKVIQSFRNQLLFIEDLNVAFENPFTGINLTLLRRYSDAGREVDFEISDNIIDSFEENKYKFFRKSLHSELFYLFSELCTNDLKYGRGESLWRISLNLDCLVIDQENFLKESDEFSVDRDLPNLPDPVLKSAMTRVHKVGGSITTSYKTKEDSISRQIKFTTYIEIPIPTTP